MLKRALTNCGALYAIALIMFADGSSLAGTFSDDPQTDALIAQLITRIKDPVKLQTITNCLLGVSLPNPPTVVSVKGIRMADGPGSRFETNEFTLTGKIEVEVTDIKSALE